MSELYSVSSSPHVRSKDTVSRTMLDVVIALSPAALFGMFYFGFGALLTIVLCVGASVLTEWGYEKLMKQRSTIHDLSAVVTGLLLAMNLPSSSPWWMSVMGSVFAILIVKQLFGGLGQNFMNPALGARAFLLISFAGLMTDWQVDAVSMATPLGIMKEGGSAMPSVMSAFLGTIPGSLGETSAVLLILGGVYLIYRKVISYRIPLVYIATTAIMVLLFGPDGFDLNALGYHLFSGGLMLGAFFMATDYSSSPTTAKGQIIMGVGAGVLTALIRLFGGYPEGVSFAILIMNLFVPLIDKYTLPKIFGEVK